MTVALPRRNLLITTMLIILVVLYTGGFIYGILILSGIQTLDPELWPLKSLPAYLIVFTLGDLSAILSYRWRNTGIIGLIATWILTAVLFLLFGPPFPTFGGPLPTILLSLAPIVFILMFGYRFWVISKNGRKEIQ